MLRAPRSYRESAWKRKQLVSISQLLGLFPKTSPRKMFETRNNKIGQALEKNKAEASSKSWKSSQRWGSSARINCWDTSSRAEPYIKFSPAKHERSTEWETIGKMHARYAVLTLWVQQTALGPKKSSHICIQSLTLIWDLSHRYGGNRSDNRQTTL